MKTITKLKLIFITVIIIFTVFNSGLPVVLHYCKMMHSFSSEQCTMCHKDDTQRGEQKFSQIIERCCISFIVVQANKNNFIKNQPKENLLNFNQLLLLTPNFCNIKTNNFTKFYLKTVPFTQFETNIPIFNSTLLI